MPGIISGTISAKALERDIAKEKISAKTYLRIVSESIRECLDKETNTVTIHGDLANDIADTLQKISEDMRK